MGLCRAVCAVVKVVGDSCRAAGPQLAAWRGGGRAHACAAAACLTCLHSPFTSPYEGAHSSQVVGSAQVRQFLSSLQNGEWVGREWVGARPVSARDISGCGGGRQMGWLSGWLGHARPGQGGMGCPAGVQGSLLAGMSRSTHQATHSPSCRL